MKKLNAHMEHKKKMGIANVHLGTVALSRIPGGWVGAFPILRKVVRVADDSAAARLLLAWDTLGGKEDVTPEEIADAAGMSMGDFIAVVAKSAFDTGVSVSKLIEALNLEDIMERAVKQAKKPDGFKDRERILQGAGLYPTTGGATFINSNVNAVDARQTLNVEDGNEDLGSMEADTIEFTTLVRRPEGQQKVESPSKLIEAVVERVEDASS